MGAGTGGVGVSGAMGTATGGSLGCQRGRSVESAGVDGAFQGARSALGLPGCQRGIVVGSAGAAGALQILLKATPLLGRSKMPLAATVSCGSEMSARFLHNVRPRPTH